MVLETKICALVTNAFQSALLRNNLHIVKFTLFENKLTISELEECYIHSVESSLTLFTWFPPGPIFNTLHDHGKFVTTIEFMLVSYFYIYIKVITYIYKIGLIKRFLNRAAFPRAIGRAPQGGVQKGRFLQAEGGWGKEGVSKRKNSFRSGHLFRESSDAEYLTNTGQEVSHCLLQGHILGRG